MKKIAMLVLAMAASMCVLAGCSSPGPSDVAGKYFDAIKSGDTEAAQSYYAGTYKTVTDVISDEAASASSSVDSETLDSVLDATLSQKLQDFDYEISNEQIDGDNATVDVKITTYNLGDAFSNFISDYLQQGISMYLSGSSEDEISQLAVTTLQQQLEGMEKSYSSTVTVPLEKVDGDWKVSEYDQNSELFDALTGGFVSSINELSNSLSSLSDTSN